MEGKTKQPGTGKRLAALILTLSLLVTMAIPVQAADSPGEGTPADIHARIAELNALIAEAAAIDLSEHPAQYAEPVAHALAKAEKVAANPAATDGQRNLARLELQVAVDTLTVDLQKATIPDMQALVKAGKLTYASLTQMYLTRIALYNDNTNRLNAVRVVNPDALADAESCDTAFAQDPSVAEGMFGIPVMMKDNINFVGLPTTAGSVALVDNYTSYDAPLVTNLKDAGAVILGKLNLTEFANGVSTSMPAGYSSLAGQVLNPYRPVRLAATTPAISALGPSGSSSGSGVAAAAALAAITIGTETSGSILSPSQSNFIVGIKPTVGIISRYGVVPLNAAQDTAGPMGRNVIDAAILMSVICGYDPNDPTTEGIAEAGITGIDFAASLNESLLENGLAGKRIGVAGQPAANNAAYPAFQAALQALREAGAEIVYQANGSALAFPSGSTPSTIVTNFNFKRDIVEYLATLDENYPMKSLQDIIDFNYAYDPSQTGAFRYGQDRLETCNSYDMVADLPRYEADRARDIAWSRTNGIDWLLNEYNLDGYIATSANNSPTSRGAKAGYPTVQIPLYTSSTQLASQVSMTFTGAAFSDPQMIEFAYVAEQAINARVAPGLAEKTSLGNALTAAQALTAAERDQILAVYNAANAAYRNDFATQMDADKLNAELREAILDMQPADKAALNEAIAFAQGLNDLYLSGAVKENYERLLANAALICADELALPSEVDAAQAALSNLLCSPAFLQAFVDFADTVEGYLLQYPEEGKEAFLQALADARALLNNSEATEAEYLEAVEALNGALMTLEPGTNILDMEVTTNAYLIQQGDFFHVDSRFAEEVRSNTVILTYLFDASKFSYEGFTPGAGMDVIETAVTDGAVKFIVMFSGYDAEDLGRVFFRAKEDADLENEDNQIKAMLSCVVKDDNGDKQIYKARAAVSFTTTRGLGEVTLVDLSNIIDAIGTDSTHSEWSRYRFFDFNNNGTIDIYDIACVASMLVR